MIKSCSSNAVSIALVVAVSNNGVIGLAGDMPWRLPDDLKWFKKNTYGKPIIMGRKTFASIGRALPGRTNIVITRDPDFSADGIEVVGSIEGAIELAQARVEKSDKSEICIIGGGEIYAQTMHLADRLYLTKVNAKIEGDTHFPDIDSHLWQITPHGRVLRDEKNTHSYEFFIYERTQ